jgi:hypothetical protein
MDSENGASSSSEQALSNAGATADQGAGSAASSDGDSAATTGGASQKPSWQDVDWSQVDPHELIKNIPSLQGVIGNLTQKQAQQLARQMAQDEQTRQAAEAEVARIKSVRDEKRRLAQEDPDKLAQVVAEEVTREEYQEWQRDIRKSMQSEFSGYLAGEVQEVYSDPDVQAIMKDADRETLEKLDWRNHKGLASWVKVVNKLVAEHHTSKKADELSKARSKAANKESVVDAARDGAGDGVDLGLAGNAPGGRLFTVDDLAQMARSGDLESYRKYKKIIAVQAQEGRIR